MAEILPVGASGRGGSLGVVYSLPVEERGWSGSGPAVWKVGLLPAQLLLRLAAGAWQRTGAHPVGSVSLGTPQALLAFLRYGRDWLSFSPASWDQRVGSLRVRQMGVMCRRHTKATVWGSWQFEKAWLGPEAYQRVPERAIMKPETPPTLKSPKCGSRDQGRQKSHSPGFMSCLSHCRPQFPYL